MLDEKLSRREVKDIQSGYKDPDRFDKWLAVLQERVAWNDPIVLPLGEALYVIRRLADGELVIRSEAGHDFCRFDENWKMHAPSSFATATSCSARSTRRWPTAIPSGWSCASSTARSPADCSRSKR